MNRSVIITADSTCDLPRELAKEKEIRISPLYVRFGEDEYRDGVDIDSDKMLALAEQSGTLPKTSACSVEDYLALWKPYTEKGCAIVHISLSSELSSSYQNARLAASETANVFVVDSRNLSAASGLLVLRARDMAEEGLGAEEIEKELLVLRDKLNCSFVLDTMQYLAKGGRCSSVAALAAGMLRLRLCISVENGKMDVCKKYRGKTEAVLRQYVGERLSAAKEPDLQRIFVAHTGVSPEVVDRITATLKEEWHFNEVLTTKAGCTISSHCGPGCLGILFFEK